MIITNLMDAFSSVRVVVEDPVFVRPTNIREPYIHTLSNLDHLNAYIPFYLPILYYFRSGADSPPAAAKLAYSLKRALADALELYPVLAGRLMKGKDGRMEVEVNGAGIEFSFATAEARLDKWEDIRYCDMELQLAPRKPIMLDDMLLGVPLACVQVTNFECGGVAICISYLHAVGDMQADAEFVETWALIHKSDPASPPMAPCLHAAALLRPQNPPRVDVPIDPLLELLGEPEDISMNDHLCNKLQGEEIETSNNGPPIINMGYAMLRMGDAKVAQAVHEVETGPYSYGKATSMEAIAALLWVGITKARGLPLHSTTSFKLPINMRRRWRPPLPSRFFGNATLPARAMAKTSDLLHHHFSYAAKLVHESIAAADWKYGQACVDFLELKLQQHGGRIQLAKSPTLLGHGLHASIMLGFPFYELDFGWGPTIQVSLPIRTALPDYDGTFIVMPTPSGGKSRELILFLKVEHLDNLLNDPSFSKYLEGEKQIVSVVH